MTAQPDERRALLEILDLLCWDSLEVPLSHVDPTDQHKAPRGEITDLFREMRDGVVELQEALREIEATDTGERARKLARIALRGSVGDSDPETDR